MMIRTQCARIRGSGARRSIGARQRSRGRRVGENSRCGARGWACAGFVSPSLGRMDGRSLFWTRAVQVGDGVRPALWFESRARAAPHPSRDVARMMGVAPPWLGGRVRFLCVAGVREDALVVRRARGFRQAAHHTECRSSFCAETRAPAACANHGAAVVLIRKVETTFFCSTAVSES